MDEAQASTRILMGPTLKRIKRIIVGIIGTTVLIVGIALLVLPGPAFLIIPLGLGILATEFVWAQRLLRKVKEKLTRSGGAQ